MFVVIFIPFKVDTRFLLKENIRIEYCHIKNFLTKKSSLRKFKYDFLMILFDDLLFKDPDPGD